MLTRRALLLGSLAATAAGCMRGGPAGHVRLGGGEHGGLYLAFADLLARQLQSRHRMVVEAVSTEGSVDNLARLRSKDLTMGLALADVAEGDRANGPAASDPVAIARVYENYLQVVVRASATTRSLDDLRGTRVSIGPGGSGAAATSAVLLTAAGLHGRVEMLRYRLRDGLRGLADGSLAAVVWSGGVPTPAIAELHARVPLRMLDIGDVAAPMSRLSGYPYLTRSVPADSYVPAGLRTIGVPNLLLCDQHADAAMVSAVVDVLASDAPQLVPPHVRGLQYLDPPSMIQTGLVPLHPAAADAFRRLHG